MDSGMIIGMKNTDTKPSSESFLAVLLRTKKTGQFSGEEGR